MQSTKEGQINRTQDSTVEAKAGFLSYISMLSPSLVCLLCISCSIVLALSVRTEVTTYREVPSLAPSYTDTPFTPTNTPNNGVTLMPSTAFQPSTSVEQNISNVPSMKQPSSSPLEGNDSDSSAHTYVPTIYHPIALPTNSPTGVKTLSPSILYTPTLPSDFCENFGQKDDEIRKILYQKHSMISISGTSEFRVQYSSNEFSIKCLPEYALSYFNDSILLSTVQLLISSDIQEIHPNAFSGHISFIKNITHLDLSNNKLSVLPNNVFAPFERLKLVTIQSNNFSTLNNNILGINSLVHTVSMSYSTNLQMFPEFIRFAPKMKVLYLLESTALNMANSLAFEGLHLFSYLLISANDTPVYSKLGRSGLAEALNINLSSIFAL